ncbi:hypothetical protein HK105_206005 [Polyrhizophydium stewartii]|uniref:Ankyrin repeat domain containing protein n=1 Tax=Polyrhizophydium stewartii TaxID=2732419 RepID=A0ABR4N4H6_9FUNG
MAATACPPPPSEKLPHGASHWDRLPAEVRRIVFDADTSVLTQLATRSLLPAELRCLSDAERTQAWADAFATEWAGPLSSLPPSASARGAAAHIRSRAMLERARAAGVAPVAVLLRVAVRNGWPDMLDMRLADQLALAAAEEGAVWLLADLIDGRRATTPSDRLVRAAAHAGRLDAVRFLHDRMRGVPWSPAVADAAAASGSLDLVVWMDASGRGGGFTGLAMAWAARGGHLAVVRWLANNTAVAHSPLSALHAALRGHVAVLDLLHERFPAMFAPDAGLSWCNVSDVRVLRWLHHRSMLDQPRVMLDNLVGAGAADSVRWLCTTFGLAVTRRMFAVACDWGHAALARWMLTQHGIVLDDHAVRSAVASGFVDLLAVFIAHDAAWVHVIADTAAKRGLRDIVEWLHVRHPGSIMPDMLSIAAEHEQLAVVQYLLDAVVGVDWDLGRARSLACGGMRRRVVGMLDAHEARRVAAQTQR